MRSSNGWMDFRRGIQTGQRFRSSGGFYERCNWTDRWPDAGCLLFRGWRSLTRSTRGDTILSTVPVSRSGGSGASYCLL